MNETDPAVQEVAVKGFTWAAAAGWSTFVAVMTAIGMFFRAFSPAELVKIVIARNKELRDEAREEEASDVTRLAVAEKRAAAAESRQVYLASAVSLLIGVVEQMDPNNPGLKQARELVAMAADSDDGFGRQLRRLAEFPGVGEK